ncbi:MAG: hypothetical protein LBT08_07435 [Synergistaceae bacterium]|nr:hypothetical protein [Synergistaceae bacterium]
MKKLNDENKNSYVNPDFEVLYAENSLMRGELATLWEELEHLNRVVIPTTQTTYLIKVGALRVELLQRQIEVMKVRRRIAMLRANLERGEVVHEEALNYSIDIEFREWDERLRHEVAQIDEAKGRFSNLAVPEDADEVRSIYRMLCRKLNPEINSDQSDEAKTFWPSIHSAYVWGDLFHLKALLMMSEDYPESYDLPSNIGGMRMTHLTLKEKLDSMTRKINNVKQHPAFEWKALLDNPDKLANEQTKLRDEIQRVSLQGMALQDLLKSLEMRGVRR